jgi:O-antigen/teichoic acid export membrane protein
MIVAPGGPWRPVALAGCGGPGDLRLGVARSWHARDRTAPPPASGTEVPGRMTADVPTGAASLGHDESITAGRRTLRDRRAQLVALASGLFRVIYAGVRIVAVPLSLAYLGTELYGVWLALTSILAWLAVADLGIPNGSLINALSEALARDDVARARRIVSSACVAMVGMAAAVIGLTAVASAIVPLGGLLGAAESDPRDVQSALLLAGGLTGAALPLAIATATLRAQQRAYFGFLAEAGGQLLMLGLLALALSGEPSLTRYAAVVAGTGVAAGALLALWLFAIDSPALSPRPALASRALVLDLARDGRYFLGFFVLDAAILYIDNLVITWGRGPAAVPTYAIPFAMFFTVYIIVAVWAQSLWPAYSEAGARGDWGWIRTAHLRSSRRSVAGMALVATGLALVGPAVVDLWTHGRVLVEPALLWVFAAAFVGWTWVEANKTLLTALGGVRQRLVATAAGVAVKLALSLALVGPLGPIGVAIGTLVGIGLVSGPLFWLFARRRLDRAGHEAAGTPAPEPAHAVIAGAEARR